MNIGAHIERMEADGFKYDGEFNAEDDIEARKVLKKREDALKRGKGSAVVFHRSSTNKRIFALFIEE
ncbi:hypothetical protein ACFL3T_04085 [Patescibacteria group bacterium]